jgi:hypothetical protein
MELPSVPSARPSSTAALTLDEIRAFYDFYNGAIAAIASARRLVKNNLLGMASPPDYPANHEAVKDICLRLAGALR